MDDMLEDEFLDYFPLGNDPILNVTINVHWFLKAPPNIVYRPLSYIHKDEIKKNITQYNEFDTKVPIFAIPKDTKSPRHIMLWKPRKWEDIQKPLVFLLLE